jgi:ADP-ribose pyrophosphatase YjhB (NUDIX family)
MYPHFIMITDKDGAERTESLKVGAFIMRGGNIRPPELLLFTHPDCPGAPIQIPGGSVEEGEALEAALWREIREETGLTDLTLLRKVGVSHYPSMFKAGEVFVRHCYLLSAPDDLPERWVHQVEGGGEDGGMRFAYEWRSIAPDFTLCGDLGVFLNPRDLPELYG